MPIISLNGPEAVRIRKNNEYATWGSRNEENRVEPIANPAFEVPFRLKSGETIFTIGSCFARNVEEELLARGFRIPIRDLFRKPEFKNLSTEIVNNFGTPSIFNEFAWAFGEKDFDEETNFLEVSKDKYIDLHMINSIRPSPLRLVQERRRGLINATRTLADCRVMIMTLGLVELWWDEVSQSYLNTGPLPSVLKQWPKRFSLHVLSFAECHDYLRRALDIAFANAKKNLSVILTVSPVPMMATHRNIDVLAANSYSKSVLRAVAEQLVAEDTRITYFPSYETVSLSNRRFAWADDFVHVNKEMIALNVERMADAFTGKQVNGAAVLPSLIVEAQESSDALLLAEQARMARISGDSKFFEDRVETAASSPAFALEYAKFLYDDQCYNEVLHLTENIDQVEAITLRTRALVAIGQPEEARDVIRLACRPNVKGTAHWRAYIETALALRSISALLEAEQEWLRAQPRSKGLIQALIGRAFRAMDEHELAIERLSAAALLPDRNDSTIIDFAIALVALNRHGEAADILEGVAGNTDWQTKQIVQLKKKINIALHGA